MSFIWKLAWVSRLMVRRERGSIRFSPFRCRRQLHLGIE